MWATNADLLNYWDSSERVAISKVLDRSKCYLDYYLKNNDKGNIGLIK